MATTFNEDVTVNADVEVVSASQTGLTVARAGSNYGLQVDESATNAATGVKIKAQAAGSGVEIATISSGTNESLALDAKGTGTIAIGANSGDVGIGTSTPAKKLDVNGEVFIEGSNGLFF